jgi:hypothetical protein
MAKTKKQTKAQKKAEIKKLVIELHAYVDKGIEFLDKNFSRADWIDKVELNKLDMHSGQVCICGQVFEEHWAGFVKQIEGEKYSIFSENRKAVAKGEALGFVCPKKYRNTVKEQQVWDLLGSIWAAEIFYLRKQG